MSLLDAVRNALMSVSRRLRDPEAFPAIDAKSTIGEAYSVVDEALLDPILRIALEQQATRADRDKLQDLLGSAERIAAFVEREKEILVRLGASREWSDAFFRDLGLLEKFPAELLEIYPPDQVYQNLDKLRLALSLSSRTFEDMILARALAPQTSRTGESDRAPRPSEPAAAAPITRGMSPLRQALAGAVHATFGVALIVGNFSGYAALLFTAPFAAPAATASYGLGGFACGRGYTRLTEAMGL